MRNLKIFIFTVIMVTLCTTITVYADEFDIVRNKWFDFLVGGNIDRTDTSIKNKITSTTNSANYHWGRMKKDANRTYLFDNYLDSATIPSQITGMYSLLEIMATAYRTNGSSLYNNQALKADIISAMDWIYSNRYNQNLPTVGNWWEWEIGTPTKLNNLIVLMYDDLTQTQIKNYTDAIQKFSPDPTICCYPYTIDATAANRLSLCMVVGLRGVIIKDAARILQARDALGKTFLYATSGDGFYLDGSFIQHGKHPYTGAYGLSLINDLSSMMYLLENSTWKIVDDNKNNIYKWVYDSFLPVLHDGIMMDIVTGRAASRSYNATYCVSTLVKTVLLLSEVADDANSKNLKSEAKRWIRINPLNNIYTDEGLFVLSLIKKVNNDDSIVESNVLALNKQYSSMDRVVHIRPNFKFALSMSSSRIYNFESILDENLAGLYSGDGMTYLYNDDLKQYTDGFWPTINQNRLPGTTVSTKNRNPGIGAQYLSPKNQVGGVSLSSIYGSAVMDLKPFNSTLSAKKSWFMFDNEIVALGAGINCTDNSSVETIIDNRMLNTAGSNTFTVDDNSKNSLGTWQDVCNNVSWMHLQGNVDGSDIGYYLPQPATVNLLKETRNKSWSEINATGSTAIVSKKYLNIWLDHSNNPNNASYEYVLLPGKTAGETKNYAMNPKVKILENDTSAQAVYQSELGITGANFWTDIITTVGGITSNKKASVMMRENIDSLEISISDPTQANSGTIDVEIGKIASEILECDDNITITFLKPTIKFSVKTALAKGKTFNIKLGTRNANSKINSIVALDHTMSLNLLNGAYTISQLGSVVFKAWATGSKAQGTASNGTFFDQITFKQNVTSNYKDHILLSSGFGFSTTKRTVVDMKYKVALEDSLVPLKPTANFSLYIPSVCNWIPLTQKAIPDDTWKTIRFIVDPVLKKVFYSENGNGFVTTNFISGTVPNMNEVRLYLVANPVAQNPTDGTTPLETPMNWTFDYINIYEANDSTTLNKLDTQLDGSNDLFSVELENYKVSYTNSTLIVSVYKNENNVLSLIDMKRFPLSGLLFGDFVKIEDSFNIDGYEDKNIIVKAFLWDDTSNLVPYDLSLQK